MLRLLTNITINKIYIFNNIFKFYLKFCILLNKNISTKKKNNKKKKIKINYQDIIF